LGPLLQSVATNWIRFTIPEVRLVAKDVNSCRAFLLDLAMQAVDGVDGLDDLSRLRGDGEETGDPLPSGTVGWVCRLIDAQANAAVRGAVRKGGLAPPSYFAP